MKLRMLHFDKVHLQGGFHFTKVFFPAGKGLALLCAFCGQLSAFSCNFVQSSPLPRRLPPH